MYKLDENTAYCRRIAQELEAYAEGRMYQDENGEIVERNDAPNNLEQLGLWDYLSDFLDVTYLVQSDMCTLDGVKVYVTLGGPSCWIDTSTNTVELRWGGDSASWGISWETAEEITAYFQEIWNSHEIWNS